MAVTLDTLKKTIGKKKTKSMAFAWLADYECMAGDVENALARVDAGLGMYPGDIPGMLVRTKILFQKGDFEECIKECERVLEKEPFCLSAQKRMGEAYEQLENIAERNHCFRRVHDMDPLDTFWKEEYEAVPEENVGMAAGAVAGAAAEAMGDADFAMPDLGDMAQPQGEESSESTLDSAVAETPAEVSSAEPQAEEKPAEEDSIFSKSLDMDIDAPAEEPAAQPAQNASPFSSSFGDEDDPFAALAALGGDDNSVEESAMDSLQQSLNSALSETGADAGDQDIAAGEEISGHDVGSAFAEMFGEDDDLDSFGDEVSKPAAPAAETAEPAEPVNASPFAQFDLPTNLDDEPEPQEENTVKNVFGDEAEDKPQSIDDAFGDIFGEDELPEELPSTKPAAKAEPEQPVDLNAWSPEPASEGGLFEKSAASDMGFGPAEDSLALDTLEEPAADEKPEETLELPEEDTTADKPQSLDSAFADIFGEDELPEELPAAKPAEEQSLELPAEDSLELPAEEDSLKLDEPELKPFEESLTLDEPSLEMPAEEPELVEPAEAVEPAELAEPAETAETTEPVETSEPVEPVELAETAEADASVAEVFGEVDAKQSLEGEGIGIDKAFDALFAEEDELPEEHAAPATEEADTDKVNVEEAALEPVEEKPAETAEVDPEKAEIDKEMGAAFSSLFAEDDDLPVDEAKPAVDVTPAPEAAETVVEDVPHVDTALEDDLDKSFNTLFGEDDALDESTIEKPKPAEEAPAEPLAADEDAVPELAGKSTDLESLESEFSGAFKQLFNTDDDSLDEKPVPQSNKGVDFLMSGDSDDEVSAGLVTDPTAPLDKLPPDIDESLNTPTLAEIYFEQGCYDKALDIYRDLSNKDPENEAIAKRLAEVEKAYNAKFGGGANG